MRARFLLGIGGCGLLCASLIAQPAPATPAGQTAPPAREPGLYATIATSNGDIVARLFELESPKTVRNFVDLALGKKAWADPKTNQRVRKPLYNGLTFHRVVPAFMIQGGDPLGNGTGGTDPIPEERHASLKFDRPGLLGMANAGLGTGSSQFFITEVPTPHLDDLHTIFGQVVQGQDVVEKIARVPRNQSTNRPLLPVRIVRVTFSREGAMPPGGIALTAPAKPKPATVKKKPAAKKPAPKKPAPAK